MGLIISAICGGKSLVNLITFQKPEQGKCEKTAKLAIYGGLAGTLVLCVLVLALYLYLKFGCKRKSGNVTNIYNYEPVPQMESPFEKKRYQ